MKKKILVGLGAIIGLILVAAIYVEVKFQYTQALRKTPKDLELQFQPDMSMVTEGKRLLQMKGCLDCHAPDLGGLTLIDDPALGLISGSNLTSGKGGLSGWSTQDFVRAIRYGLGPKGQLLKFMPSNEFSRLTDEDLSRIIAAIQAAPPIDRSNIPIHIGPLGKVLFAIGKMPLLFTGLEIGEDFQPHPHLKPEPTASYGSYMINGCIGCHNPNLTGGPIVGVPPDWPPAADITSNGRLSRWSLEQFRVALKTGKTPEGKSLNPRYMPWPAFAAMTDTETEAIYNYLKDLKPL